MTEANGAGGLVARDVVVRFGGLVANDGASAEVHRGRITGLIGPNGAGKTTFFNVCCGFQPADAGTVTLDGTDITHEPPERRARRGMGRTFQRMELFRSLTVRENVEAAVESQHIGSDPLSQLGLRSGGRATRREIRDRAAEVMDRIGITGIAASVAGRISTGQGRLVELARAVARQPSILLLDEPSSGLDPVESQAFGDQLVRLVTDDGLGILLVEHDIEMVLRICSWIHVLDFGKPLLAGPPEELRKSEILREAYLGRALDEPA
jgi:ABC-type branched-subunit amino acid transport system ATPase component